MITVRVYDDYNLIALQDLDTNHFDGCEFSKKFRVETTVNSPPTTTGRKLSSTQNPRPVVMFSLQYTPHLRTGRKISNPQNPRPVVSSHEIIRLLGGSLLYRAARCRHKIF